MQQCSSFSGSVDWVEDLFPPTFRFLNKSDNGRITQESKIQNDLCSANDFQQTNVDEKFEQLFSKNISTLDIESIKNIYQRVWIMMKANAADDDVENKEATHDASVQTENDCIPSTDVDVENMPCIWNSAEIGVIRNAFRSTSEDNAGLRGHLAVLETDFNKLQLANKRQLKVVQSLTEQLKEAVCANRRLHMLAEHLKRELDNSSDTVHQLRLEKELKDKLECSIEQLKAELAANKRREKQQKESNKVKWLALLDKRRLEETASQIELKSEVAKLVDKVDELTLQLAKERTDHARTRTALEHLRIHFSSLPNIIRTPEHNLMKLDYR